MLVWLLEWLSILVSPDQFAALEKITFRGALAAAVAFGLAIWLGPRMIGWLARRYREPNKSDSPRLQQLHALKDATPTMGGLFLVAGVLAALVLLADLQNPFVHVALFVTVGLGTLGVADDLVKLRSPSRGVSIRTKLLVQTGVAAMAAIWLYHCHGEPMKLWVPLVNLSMPIGWGFVPLAVLVIVGTSNAVNLADGLDGLAGGCLLVVIGAMAAVTYAAGHADIAEYLGIARVSGAGELAVLAAAMAGGVLGFLWFNCHPAQVFMGDTGSLPLGGLVGVIAVAARQELLLLLVGGVFVVEAASVVVQVVSYRWRGRRVFLCAPLHHHFQFKGWPESRVVVRFWIASAVCAILGVACLKVNIREEAVAPVGATAIAGQPAVGEQESARKAQAALGQYSVQPCEYLSDGPPPRGRVRLEAPFGRTVRPDAPYTAGGTAALPPGQGTSLR